MTESSHRGGNVVRLRHNEFGAAETAFQWGKEIKLSRYQITEGSEDQIKGIGFTLWALGSL